MAGKKGCGKQKGATSFCRVRLVDLNEWFNHSTDNPNEFITIPIARRWALENDLPHESIALNNKATFKQQVSSPKDFTEESDVESTTVVASDKEEEEIVLDW